MKIPCKYRGKKKKKKCFQVNQSVFLIMKTEALQVLFCNKVVLEI